MVNQVSSRSTKAQILEAFEQLYAEHEQLRREYDRLLNEKEAAGAKTAKLGAPAKTGEAPKIEPIMEEAQTIDTILDGLVTLQAGFGDALNTLSAKLTAETSRLLELRLQIEARASQLAELHALKIAEDTLDKLTQEYRHASEVFEQETKEKRQALEQEISQKRHAWEQQQKEHARAVKERNEGLKKGRQRENAEYTYSLQMQRRLEAEQYEQEQKRLRSELEESSATKDKEWAERERAIAGQESKYRELDGMLEAMPDQLATAIKQAEKEGTDIARRQAKIRDDQLQKKEEGDRRVAELNIQALEETVQKQAQQIESLSAQLEAVVRQDQELAVKAIESASQATSFQSIREIALEQAKNPPKGK